MRSVPQRHVRDFVGEHAGHFALITRVIEHAAIEEDDAARQSERVNVRLIHNVELILEVWPG